MGNSPPSTQSMPQEAARRRPPYRNSATTVIDACAVSPFGSVSVPNVPVQVTTVPGACAASPLVEVWLNRTVLVVRSVPVMVS